jgi:hypothetical protein
VSDFTPDSITMNDNSLLFSSREIREGIIRCILATDMARHNDILTQFRETMPVFDYKNTVHKNLVSLNVIKVHSCGGRSFVFVSNAQLVVMTGKV